MVFKYKTLEKYKDILSIRKDHVLKYKNVILPTSINGIQDFHLNCYETFTASKVDNVVHNQYVPMLKQKALLVF